MLNLTRWATVLFFTMVVGVAGAYAQATRTWVSGVGDDVNPCSRTAPCKTFAGAISKTAAGGEINVLDPGGFGALTITKAITIDGSGSLAGILAAGTNGINVNAGAIDVVILRNLEINGAGTGLNGIRFLSGGMLVIENSTVFGFTQAGIHFQPSGASALSIDRTMVHKNAGGGLLLRPGALGTATATVSGSRFERNTFGVRAEDRSKVTIGSSVASHSPNNGFVALSASGPAEVSLEGCISSNNGSSGVVAQGAVAIVRISNATITNNGTGINSVTGGQVISFGNNRIAGNTVDGVPTGTVNEQ